MKTTFTQHPEWHRAGGEQQVWSACYSFSCCSQLSTVWWSKCTQQERTGCTILDFFELPTYCPRHISMGKMHSYQTQKMYMLLSTFVASISAKLMSYLQYKNLRLSSLYCEKKEIVFTSSTFTRFDTYSGNRFCAICQVSQNCGSIAE